MRPVVLNHKGSQRWCVQTMSKPCARWTCGTTLAVFLLGILFVYYRTLPETNPCEALERLNPRVRSNTGLPRIIHQQWPKGRQMPPYIKRWYDKWDQLFPGFEHRLWGDEEIRDLVASEFPFFLPTYDGYPFNIMRVDAARTFILYKYGGLYADMDYEPLVNFWDRFPDDRPALIESFWRHEDFQNSFMVSPPRHGFWNVTWDVMMERSKEFPDHDISQVPFISGPMAIDEAVARWNGGSSHRPRLLTLPCVSWHRVSTGYQASGREMVTRTWIYYFKLTFKTCGSTFDLRCQQGIHHSTTMWG